MRSKREISDMQFKVQFDQANRDFVTNLAIYALTSLMSVTALLVAVFSIIFSVSGLNSYTIIVAIVFVIIGGIYWIQVLPHARKCLKNAKNINEQLQKELFDLCPEYKKKFH